MEKLDIQTAREIVWEKLRPVAVPDPDFGYDFPSSSPITPAATRALACL